jgi:arginyl-tRNA synthetase
MLIEHLLDVDGAEHAESFSVRDLNEFYAAARQQFDTDLAFAERSRRRVVLLQSGDPETLRLWRIFVAESMRHAREVYELLGVLLTDDDTLGESFYNPLLPVVVEELGADGLLVEDGGALCVFPAGFENRSGEPLPLIVRKSDGGYGYPATDLACLRDRTQRLGATRLLYVVGAEQSLHLRMVFAVGVLAGYLPNLAVAEHVAFGLVLGTDGKKMASRGGGSERLIDLLQEGIDLAAAALKERSSDLAPEQQATVARALGIGAVKYADLSTERVRDYVFDWDRMLAFEGDTGPYLQYAHARIRSIFRRGEVDPPAPGAVPILGEQPERALALQLLRFAGAVEATAETMSPSKLCTYLYELAAAFTGFYEACRVLVDDDALRASRLGLCDLTARVLEQGLALLGMEAPDQM